MSTSPITDKTFEDITGLILSTPSFLNLLPIELDENGDYILNIFRFYSIYDSIKNDVVYFNTYEADEDDWWENIAYDVYNNVDLWWVTCMMNDVINPFEEIEPGKNLKILKTEAIPNLIREIRTRAEEHIQNV